MVKFKQNVSFDFEQAPKNDKKDYNIGVKKFFNKSLIKNFKKVPYYRS